MTGIISADSNLENSESYSIMKQIHVIVKETSPYLGIFALIYSIVNNFLNNQNNSDDGSYAPKDNIPIKNPDHNNDYSDNSGDFSSLDKKSDLEYDKNDNTQVFSDTSSSINNFSFEDYSYALSDSDMDNQCSSDCSVSTLILDKRIINQILEDGFTIMEMQSRLTVFPKTFQYRFLL